MCQRSRITNTPVFLILRDRVSHLSASVAETPRNAWPKTERTMRANLGQSECTLARHRSVINPTISADVKVVFSSMASTIDSCGRSDDDTPENRYTVSIRALSTILSKKD